MSLSVSKDDEEAGDLGLTMAATDDDEKLIESYEELFSNRYTDNDEEYMETVKNPPKDPPIVHPWYNKPRRNYNYARPGNRNDSHHGGDRRNDRRYNDHHGRDHHRRDGNHSRDRRPRSRSPIDKQRSH